MMMMMISDIFQTELDMNTKFQLKLFVQI
jgi:hypothetical protein